MGTNIMIARPLTAIEALALLAEPAIAALFDLDDHTVQQGFVVCTSDGRTVECQVPRRTADSVAGHRVSLEFHDGGRHDGSGCFVSIRGRAQTPESGEPAAAASLALPTDLVALRVVPESVRASRFDPIGPSGSADGPTLG
jgi:hypothetical protein